MTMELHPEFIKYWYKKGYVIHKVPGVTADPKQWYIVSIINNKPGNLVAYYDFFHKELVYHLYKVKQNHLTEKEMLSYVRLTAFI